VLKTIRNFLFGRGKPSKDRRHTPAAGPCPAIGASLVKRNVVMKVTEPMAPEFWDWLVLAGWREVRMSRNRRKYLAAPPGAFRKLSRVASQERETLYRKMLGPMTTGK
jgi:hypothetical protein